MAGSVTDWLELPEVSELQAVYLPPPAPPVIASDRRAVYFDQNIQLDNPKRWARNTYSRDGSLDAETQRRLATEWASSRAGPGDVFANSPSLRDPVHREVLRSVQACLVDGELFLWNPYANLNSLYGGPPGAMATAPFSFLPPPSPGRPERTYSMRELGMRLASALCGILRQRDSLQLLVVTFDREERASLLEDLSTYAPRQQMSERRGGEEASFFLPSLRTPLLPGQLSSHPDQDSLVRELVGEAVQSLLKLSSLKKRELDEETLRRTWLVDDGAVQAWAQLLETYNRLHSRWQNEQCDPQRKVTLLLDYARGNAGPQCLRLRPLSLVPTSLGTKASASPLIWKVRSEKSLARLRSWVNRHIRPVGSPGMGAGGPVLDKLDRDQHGENMLQGHLLAETGGGSSERALLLYALRLVQLGSPLPGILVTPRRAASSATPGGTAVTSPGTPTQAPVCLEILSDQPDALVPPALLTLASAPLPRYSSSAEEETLVGAAVRGETDRTATYPRLLETEAWALWELSERADVYLRHVLPAPGPEQSPQRLWCLSRLASTCVRHMGERLYAYSESISDEMEAQAAQPPGAPAPPPPDERQRAIQLFGLKGLHDAAAVGNLGLLMACERLWAEEGVEDSQGTRASMANLVAHWEALIPGTAPNHRLRALYHPLLHLPVLLDLARGLVQTNDWNLHVFLLQRIELAMYAKAGRTNQPSIQGTLERLADEYHGAKWDNPRRTLIPGGVATGGTDEYLPPAWAEAVRPELERLVDQHGRFLVGALLPHWRLFSMEWMAREIADACIPEQGPQLNPLPSLPRRRLLINEQVRRTVLRKANELGLEEKGRLLAWLMPDRSQFTGTTLAEWDAWFSQRGLGGTGQITPALRQALKTLFQELPWEHVTRVILGETQARARGSGGDPSVLSYLNNVQWLALLRRLCNSERTREQRVQSLVGEWGKAGLLHWAETGTSAPSAIKSLSSSPASSPSPLDKTLLVSHVRDSLLPWFTGLQGILESQSGFVSGLMDVTSAEAMLLSHACRVRSLLTRWLRAGDWSFATGGGNCAGAAPSLLQLSNSDWRSDSQGLYYVSHEAMAGAGGALAGGWLLRRDLPELCLDSPTPGTTAMCLDRPSMLGYSALRPAWQRMPGAVLAYLRYSYKEAPPSRDRPRGAGDWQRRRRQPGKMLADAHRHGVYAQADATSGTLHASGPLLAHALEEELSKHDSLRWRYLPLNSTRLGSPQLAPPLGTHLPGLHHDVAKNPARWQLDGLLELHKRGKLPSEYTTAYYQLCNLHENWLPSLESLYAKQRWVQLLFALVTAARDDPMRAYVAGLLPWHHGNLRPGPGVQTEAGSADDDGQVLDETLSLAVPREWTGSHLALDLGQPGDRRSLANLQEISQLLHYAIFKCVEQASLLEAAAGGRAAALLPRLSAGFVRSVLAILCEAEDKERQLVWLQAASPAELADVFEGLLLLKENAWLTEVGPEAAEDLLLHVLRRLTTAPGPGQASPIPDRWKRLLDVRFTLGSVKTLVDLKRVLWLLLDTTWLAEGSRDTRRPLLLPWSFDLEEEGFYAEVYEPEQQGHGRASFVLHAAPSLGQASRPLPGGEGWSYRVRDDTWDGRTYLEVVRAVRMYDPAKDEALKPSLSERADLLLEAEAEACAAWYGAISPVCLAGVGGELCAREGSTTLHSHGWLLRWLDRLGNESRRLQDWMWPASLRRLSLQRYKRVQGVPPHLPLTPLYPQLLRPQLSLEDMNSVSLYWQSLRAELAGADLFARRNDLRVRAETFLRYGRMPGAPSFVSPEVIPSQPAKPMGLFSMEVLSLGNALVAPAQVAYLEPGVSRSPGTAQEWISLAQLHAHYPHARLQQLLPWPHLYLQMDSAELGMRAMTPEQRRLALPDAASVLTLCRGLAMLLQDPVTGEGTASGDVDSAAHLLEQVLVRQALVVDATLPLSRVANGTQRLLLETAYAPSPGTLLPASTSSMRSSLSRLMLTIHPEAATSAAQKDRQVDALDMSTLARMVAPRGSTDPLGDVRGAVRMTAYSEKLLDMLRPPPEQRLTRVAEEEAVATGVAERAADVQQALTPGAVAVRAAWLSETAQQGWLLDARMWASGRQQLSKLQVHMLSDRLMRWDLRDPEAPLTSSGPRPGGWLDLLFGERQPANKVVAVTSARGLHRLRKAFEWYAVRECARTPLQWEQIKKTLGLSAGRGAVVSYPLGLFAADELGDILLARSFSQANPDVHVQVSGPGTSDRVVLPAPAQEDPEASQVILTRPLPLPSSVGYYEKRREVYDSAAFLTTPELAAHVAQRNRELAAFLAQEAGGGGDYLGNLSNEGKAPESEHDRLFAAVVGEAVHGLVASRDNKETRYLTLSAWAESQAGQALGRKLLGEYTARRQAEATRLVPALAQPEHGPRLAMCGALLRRDFIPRHPLAPPAYTQSGMVANLLLATQELLDAAGRRGGALPLHQFVLPGTSVHVPIQPDLGQWRTALGMPQPPSQGATPEEGVTMEEAIDVCLRMLAREIRGTAFLYRLTLPGGHEPGLEEVKTCVHADALASVGSLARVGLVYVEDGAAFFEPLSSPSL